MNNNNENFRLKWISAPLMRLFRKVTPTMSSTEQEALEAGSVWWDGELFSGKPQWNKLLSLPAAKLSKEEQAFVDGPVNTLCNMLDDWQITQEDKDLPENVWQYIKDNGFFSMIIPKHYGGKEFSAYAHSQVVMMISTRSISAAVTIMVPNSLGPGKLLLEYGTEEQKDHYLPRLAKGQEIPCFALTSPQAGSDAGAIPDFGIVCKEKFEGKKDVLGMRVTWDKRYITLGPVATLLGLAFKLYDPEHLLGETEELGITLALIPTKTKGVNIGNRHFPLNMVFMNGPNSGDNVFIPMDWIIGGEKQVGQGWRMLMECLSDGRAISLPALSTGAGKLASLSVGAYSRVRQQFKMPIGKFEGVEEALARIGGLTYIMDASRSLTLAALDNGEKPSVISAVVKYHLTESMRKVVNDGMDILGGAGICLGPKNIMGRAYQAIPISITVEGANILTRSMIIFGQGAIRSHPFIYKELESLSEHDENEALEQFDRALFGHIHFFFSNIIRCFFNGITNALFIRAPSRAHSKVKRYYKQATRMSAAFALVTDISLMVLGGSLKRREKISARLGDILSHLYLLSAVLKHFQDQGEHESDLPFVHWACQYNLQRIQTAFNGFLHNFPNRPIALLLRWIIFPWGRLYAPPNDGIGHQIAELLINPSEMRNRLTNGVFIPEDQNQSISQLENALIKAVDTAHLEKQVRPFQKTFKPEHAGYNAMLAAAQAEGIIDKDEETALREANDLRSKVIAVDDFTFDLKMK
ncbi:MAG: acyl-CoA dehydrogenase [Woeseiaceae bacterium]